ncbi:MAG: TRAP transporter substrate-binding protein DctP [Salinarimonas sp.]
MHRRTLLLAAALAALAAAAPAAAQDRTLRVGTFLSPQGVWHVPLQHLIEAVHAADVGLRLEIVADPSSVSPFQLGNALQGGVVDLAYLSGSFYTTLVPEADANKLFNIPVQELRENGAIDLMDQIHRERMGAVFLGKLGDGIQYHLFTGKPLDSPVMTGWNMRGTPLYRPFLQALGANVVQMQGSEVYPAMEGGVIDGYAWPLWGIGDIGLLEVTEYRVEPGFYNAEISVLVNERTWESLAPEQQAALTEAMIETEDWFIEYRNQTDASQRALQDEAGIEPITFSEEVNAQMIQTADDAAWVVVIQNSPQYGERIRELTYR